MMYVRFPLSLRNVVEDLLHDRGIDISHETVRFWWNGFVPLFAAEIREKRVSQMRAYSNWQWHLDEVFVKINGETHYLWRAVDHESLQAPFAWAELADVMVPLEPKWASATPSIMTNMTQTAPPCADPDQ
jgi:hypothetical protein